MAKRPETGPADVSPAEIGANAAGPNRVGPDVVIAGASRSGTSYLAAHLAAHPSIDPGSVKEPNYFSRFFDRGSSWYDGLFSARTPGLRRMDASTSYTYPQFADALDRLAEASPDAFVVYSVRDPIPRAVSHFLYYRYYFRMEKADDFGEALRANSYYADVGDYSFWLSKLLDTFSDSRILVVPFELVTGSGPEVVAEICRGIGIAPPESAVAEERVKAHQNNVVEFRSEGIRLAVKKFRRNRVYLRLRSTIGPHRIRRVRSLFTRSAVLPSVEEALATCDEAQLRELRELEDRSRAAVEKYLIEQDDRIGLDWARHWTSAREA